MSNASTRTFEEGDRCSVCLHWWWRDGGWHSLVPITYADHPKLQRPVVCPHCAEVEGV